MTPKIVICCMCGTDTYQTWAIRYRLPGGLAWICKACLALESGGRKP